MRFLCGTLCALVLWFTVEPWIHYSCAEVHAPAKCHDSHSTDTHGAQTGHEDHREAGDYHVCCQVAPASVVRMHLPRPVGFEAEFIGPIQGAPMLEDVALLNKSSVALQHGPSTHRPSHTQALLSTFLI